MGARFLAELTALQVISFLFLVCKILQFLTFWEQKHQLCKRTKSTRSLLAKSTRRYKFPEALEKAKPRARNCSSRHLVFRSRCCGFLSTRKLAIMAGEGGVDIDLYATVDEFEPEVAGQVRFRGNFKRRKFYNVHFWNTLSRSNVISATYSVSLRINYLRNVISFSISRHWLYFVMNTFMKNIWGRLWCEIVYKLP